MAARHCGRCGRDFEHLSSYRQHLLSSSNHHYCGDCNKDLKSKRGLEQHYIQSPRHHYCRGFGCPSPHFDDHDELIAHCLEDHYYCDRCDRFFNFALGLHQHNRQCHHYCVDCRRVFNSENGLRMVSPFVVYCLDT